MIFHSDRNNEDKKSTQINVLTRVEKETSEDSEYQVIP